MTDMLRIKSLLVSKVVSKLIERYIFKKTGYNVSLQLDDFVATYDGNSMKLNVTAAIDIDKNDFQYLCSEVISGDE